MSFAKFLVLRWRLWKCKTPQERTFVRRSVSAKYRKRSAKS